MTGRKALVACLTIAVGLVSSVAMASPDIQGVAVEPRVWNDDGNSTFTVGNNYATSGSLWIQDAALDGDGTGGEWANRHHWRLSEDSGPFASATAFQNGDGFAFSMDLMLSGPANSEAGIQIAPWWSATDGIFNVRTSDGEIACFGGRLPFYSFTGSHGLNYVKGDTINIGVIYEPNGLSESSPATLEYQVTYNGTDYTSGPLAFDKGNEAEAAEHGLWGMLSPAYVGGYFTPQIVSGDSSNYGRLDLTNMTYVPEPTGLVLLALGGIALLRRR